MDSMNANYEEIDKLSSAPRMINLDILPEETFKKSDSKRFRFTFQGNKNEDEEKNKEIQSKLNNEKTKRTPVTILFSYEKIYKRKEITFLQDF